MANGVTKPTQTAEQKTVEALTTLFREKFLVLPATPKDLSIFLNDVAKEYVRLRTENPDSNKFQTLQTALATARAHTDDPMMTPSAVVTLNDNAPGAFFGKRSINKYLENLA
jgi:hypothetical protein